MTTKTTYCGARIKEPIDFHMIRPEGTIRYMLLHFLSPVDLFINGKKEVINPGGVILFEPGVQQNFMASTTRLIHDYVDFEILDEKFLKEINFPVNQVIYPRVTQQISTAINLIHQNLRSNNIGSEYQCDAILISLLTNISRKVSKKPNLHNYEKTEDIRTKVEELRINLYENPTGKTVNGLASEIGFSEPYFNKIYKSLFNVSPKDDLSKARIEYAKEQLLKGVSASEIARNIGFATNEYFYNWFKKSLGLSPREFVNKNN